MHGRLCSRCGSSKPDFKPSRWDAKVAQTVRLQLTFCRAHGGFAGCRVRQVRATSVIGKMDKPLTEVFSPIKSGDRSWAVFDPLDDVLAITQAALANPLG